jgi:hypothetical protein
MIFSHKSAFALLLNHIYTTTNVLYAILLIFGIQKLVNVNGVLKPLSIKNKVVDAFVHQIHLSYIKVIAFHVIRQNIGTTKLKDASIAQIVLYITV